MNKQKEIEEIAHTIAQTNALCPNDCNGICAMTIKNCKWLRYARILYDSGYRKAEEVRKETAKEVLQKVEKNLLDRTVVCGKSVNYGDITTLELDDIRKEYGVEVEE